MADGSMNYVAVLAATGVNVGVQYLWYHRASAQFRLKEAEVKPGEDGRYRLPWGLMLLTSLLLSYALAVIFAAAGINTWAEGLMFGFIIGFGVIAMVMTPVFVIERRPRWIFLLHAGGAVLSIVVMGFILGGWQ